METYLIFSLKYKIKARNQIISSNKTKIYKILHSLYIKN